MVSALKTGTGFRFLLMLRTPLLLPRNDGLMLCCYWPPSGHFAQVQSRRPKLISVCVMPQISRPKQSGLASPCAIWFMRAFRRMLIGPSEDQAEGIHFLIS
jgi:hypothetical protein